ncbi:50S ribosomal protein L25 [Pantoea sp. Aalb]|uniref:50S ribosomal protein L25 n=1 Tax=Pantoea sp. Aalb TaxID=2576762 RepID=UPI00132B0A80|nr:50S ribosomal protein L25 [Pantoea sp. Aalb]MXP67320.1 50S ribosomal protein L25 [Pantoea sp. Aalb]
MFIIHAEVRKKIGKNASRRLRVKNKFPAIIYGGLDPAIFIALSQDTVSNIHSKPDFYNKLLTIIVDGKETKVKVKAIQRHPFKPKLQHIDFIRSI